MIQNNTQQQLQSRLNAAAKKTHSAWRCALFRPALSGCKLTGAGCADKEFFVMLKQTGFKFVVFSIHGDNNPFVVSEMYAAFGS